MLNIAVRILFLAGANLHVLPDRLRLRCALGQNTKSKFLYHVHQLLEEVPRRLPEGGDDLVQVVVADPLLEHLLQAGNDQAHTERFGFCTQGDSVTAEIKCLLILFHFSCNFQLLFECQ